MVRALTKPYPGAYTVYDHELCCFAKGEATLCRVCLNGICMLVLLEICTGKGQSVRNAGVPERAYNLAPDPWRHGKEVHASAFERCSAHTMLCRNSRNGVPI